MRADRLAGNPTKQERADAKKDREAGLEPKRRKGSKACGCHVLAWAERVLRKAQGMAEYQRALAAGREARTLELMSRFDLTESQLANDYAAAVKAESSDD